MMAISGMMKYFFLMSHCKVKGTVLPSFVVFRKHLLPASTLEKSTAKNALYLKEKNIINEILALAGD